MSYMNDDCDPFGMPYKEISNEEEKEYTFQSLKELYDRKRSIETELAFMENDRKIMTEDLKKRIKDYVHYSAVIECDEYGNWIIIVDEFDLNQLEDLKKDFGFENIKVKCCRVKGEYKDKEIKIFLYV